MKRNDYKFYKCFSIKQKDFLVNSKGIECLFDALDPCTYDKFWLFERNDNLDKALTEWKITKKINKV